MPAKGQIRDPMPIGTQIGYWTVIGDPVSGSNGIYRVLCRCQCGLEQLNRMTDLRRGQTQSCGCSQKGTPDERFWRRVRKQEGGCWLWTGSLSPGGYGRYSIRNGWVMAHRHSYEMVHGLIDKGLELHHRCETPACVNPDHLQPVTHREHCVEITKHSLPAINAA